VPGELVTVIEQSRLNVEIGKLRRAADPRQNGGDQHSVVVACLAAGDGAPVAAADAVRD